MKTNTKSYVDLINTILNQSHPSCCKTDGTMEMLNTSLAFSPYQIVVNPFKAMHPAYFVGELCWYLSGSNKLDFIKHNSKFWEKIAEPDGTCRSAYGYLMNEGHGFNQLDKVIEVLKADPNSRQAIIHLHKHSDTKTKDEICTLSLQFLIRDGRLIMIVNMRSNDLMLGLPYDMAMFSTYQQLLAISLDVRCGEYYHNAGSSHIYARDLINCLGDKRIIDTGTYRLQNNFMENLNKLLAYENELRSDYVNNVCINKKAPTSCCTQDEFMAHVLFVHYSFKIDKSFNVDHYYKDNMSVVTGLEGLNNIFIKYYKIQGRV